jgi:hypothetical protein
MEGGICPPDRKQDQEKTGAQRIVLQDAEIIFYLFCWQKNMCLIESRTDELAPDLLKHI